MLSASNCRGGGRLLSFIPPLSYRFDGEIHASSSTSPRANRSLAKVPAELSFTVYGVSSADPRAGGATKSETGFGVGNGRLARRSRRGRAVRVWQLKQNDAKSALSGRISNPVERAPDAPPRLAREAGFSRTRCRHTRRPRSFRFA